MAGTVTMRVNGLDKVERQIALLPKRVLNKVLSKSVRAGAKIIQKEAKRLAPKGKSYVRKSSKGHVFHVGGSLRRSLKVRASKTRKRGEIKFVVTTSAKDSIFTGEQFYGGFQEMGYRVGKRSREVKRLQWRVSSKSSSALTRKAAARTLDHIDQRKHIPGKKFMYRALLGKGQQAVRVIGGLIVIGVQREAAAK